MTLEEQLIRDEGEILHLYYDSENIPSIGVGCNLNVRVPPEIAKQITITPEASRAEFHRRLSKAQRDVLSALPWILSLDEPRQGVLVNMTFNMGIGSSLEGTGLQGFRKFLTLVRAGYYEEAAHEMLDSRWAHQVGQRAIRLADQMRSGICQ